jgi:hypothetical protein
MARLFRNCSYVLVLSCITLALSATAQTYAVPQPLTDEEFGKVLLSSDTLDWMRIVALTDQQAKKLAKYENAWYRPDVGQPAMMTLWLRGLEILTDDQAYILKRSKAMCLLLDGLDSLTNEQASCLSSYRAQRSILSGALPDGWDAGHLYGAVALGVISLNGVSHLSDTQAKKLGQSQASAINLNGLKSLTEVQAKSLAKFEGIVDLDGLDLAAVGLFIKYKGRLRPADPAPQKGPQLFIRPEDSEDK